MAGDEDDLTTLMDYADEALRLGAEIPSHEIIVVGSGEGLQFAATRRSPDGPGPYLYMGSAAGVRRVLGGKPGDSAG
jgi:hypothetical protein